MGFIQLTQIQKDENSSYVTTESEIMGKIALPKELLRKSVIMETYQLAPPKGFYYPEQINYEISTSQIFLNCPMGKNMPISVAENFETILKELELENKPHILLHDVKYVANGKYKLVTFSLDIDCITHIAENHEVISVSVDDLIDTDKANLNPSSLGRHYSRIITNLLDEGGNLQCFYSIESVEYIHSKM